MNEVRTMEDLIEQLSIMNNENPVSQIIIPGKGKFTIVLHMEDVVSNDSSEAVKEGHAKSASELIRNPFL
jgi:hypothetical protein